MDTPDSKQHPNTRHLAEHQWKPGQSGNPGGRPKTRVVRDALREALKSGDNLHDVAKNMVEIAKGDSRGAVSAFKEIRDMIDGPIETRIAGHDGGALRFDKTISDVDEDRLRDGE